MHFGFVVSAFFLGAGASKLVEKALRNLDCSSTVFAICSACSPQSKPSLASGAGGGDAMGMFMDVCVRQGRWFCLPGPPQG